MTRAPALTSALLLAGGCAPGVEAADYVFPLEPDGATVFVYEVVDVDQREASAGIIAQRLERCGVAFTRVVVEPVGEAHLEVRVEPSPTTAGRSTLGAGLARPGELRFAFTATDEEVAEGADVEHLPWRDREGQLAVLRPDEAFTQAQFARVFVAANPHYDERGKPSGEFFPTLGIELAAEHQEAFTDWTAANVDRSFAVIIDGRVFWAPRLIEPLGSTLVLGQFGTEAEVFEHVVALGAGPLPTVVRAAEVRSEQAEDG